MNFMRKTFLTTVAIAGLGLSGCASQKDMAIGEVYDPLEPYNRAVFAFNDGVDTVILNPLTEVYRFVLPDAFRTAISNFLTNIKAPVHLANELLQGDLDDAALVTKRFVFNTFTGFGGILDTASWEGMTYEGEDFGQTLATWGVGSGPYVVIPIIGPSTTRDSVGMVVDMAIDPVNWWMWDNNKTDLEIGRLAATTMTLKDEYMDIQKDLKSNSLDYYAAVRSVWMQRRNSLINEGEMDDYYEEY